MMNMKYTNKKQADAVKRAVCEYFKRVNESLEFDNDDDESVLNSGIVQLFAWKNDIDRLVNAAIDKVINHFKSLFEFSFSKLTADMIQSEIIDNSIEYHIEIYNNGKHVPDKYSACGKKIQYKIEEISKYANKFAKRLCGFVSMPSIHAELIEETRLEKDVFSIAKSEERIPRLEITIKIYFANSIMKSKQISGQPVYNYQL